MAVPLNLCNNTNLIVHASHSQLSPSSTLSFLYKTHLLSLPRPRFPKPRTNIFHAKLEDSTMDRPEETDGSFFYGDDLVEDESDDEDENESSVDLLIRFLQSMCRKVSKRAKKASRSVLPSAISPQLVSFAVDGVLLLASLSIVKALLEVACNLGGAIFMAILLLRVILASVSYFQSGSNGFNQGGDFSGTRPAM